MVINWALISASLPVLLKGMIVSLHIMIMALAVGLCLGTLLGILESRSHWIVRILVKVYVNIIRGTPMMVQIAFFYFVLPMLGFSVSAFWTAIIAIGINSSAYVSEIIRSGISAVGRDQIEAAKVLGFTPFQTIWYFVLPQAVRYVIPALANESISLLKDTSLASTIGVTELYKEGRSIINESYDVLSVFVILAVMYLVLTTTISFIAQMIQKWMNKYA